MLALKMNTSPTKRNQVIKKLCSQIPIQLTIDTWGGHQNAILGCKASNPTPQPLLENLENAPSKLTTLRARITRRHATYYLIGLQSAFLSQSLSSGKY